MVGLRCPDRVVLAVIDSPFDHNGARARRTADRRPHGQRITPLDPRPPWDWRIVVAIIAAAVITAVIIAAVWP